MGEKISFEPGLLSPRDIWDRCKKLQPGEFLEGLFVFGAATADGPIPLSIQVQKSNDESRLVFLFHINDENVFRAHALERDAQDEIVLRASYTYAELQRALIALAGPTSTGRRLGFMAVKPKTPQGDAGAIPVLRPRDNESRLDRMRRLRSESLRTYLSVIEPARQKTGFEVTARRIVNAYNKNNRLVDRIISIASTDEREWWGKPPIELRRERSLPIDTTVTSIEEAVSLLRETLVIRVLYGTHSTTDHDAIVPLNISHIATLAAFRQSLLDIASGRESPLIAPLRRAGITQIKLEFAANVRYSPHDAEYRTVPITEVCVP